MPFEDAVTRLTGNNGGLFRKTTATGLVLLLLLFLLPSCAAQAAAFPVGPLPVAVIEPSLPALLVPPVGGPPLLPPRFPPAALAAVLVPPVTMTADPEHQATAGPPAEPPP